MTQQKSFSNPVAFVLGLSAIFFLVFLFISGVVLLKKPTLKKDGSLTSSSFFSQELVGIVEIEGVILDSKKTLKKLETFEEDDRVKAVVLRLNSPGGVVAPSQEIYEAVKNFKKPLVVSMGTVAASGAYYIACGAKKIFANPGTITGSIGVIMEFVNLEKLYEWAKIHRYAIKTGKFKGSGSEYQSLKPEERELFQEMLDDVLLQFKEAVSIGRNLPMSKVSAIADGRVFSGHQALEVHLVDQLGTLKDAVLEAAKLAQIKGKPKTISAEKKKRKWIELLLDDSLTKSTTPSRFLGGSFESIIERLFSVFQTIQGSSLQGAQSVPAVYWIWGGGVLGRDLAE